MRASILKRTSRWLGASALALLVGIGGVSTAFVMTGQVANAQVQNAAQIIVPDAIQPQAGFADLVEAVKPAVVSILVEAEESPRNVPRLLRPVWRPVRWPRRPARRAVPPPLHGGRLGLRDLG